MNEQLPTGLARQDELMIIALIMFVWGKMQIVLI